MSEHLMAQNTGAQLTFFPEASHASHLVTQVNARARMMLDSSGRKCLELSERLNLPSLLLRMLMASSAWCSTKCSLRWKQKAISRKRLLFQLVPSMHHIGGIGSGWLPTPTAMMSNTTPAKFRARQIRLKAKHKGRTGNGCGPSLAQYVRMYPTPTARDFRHSGSRDGYHRRKGKHVQALNEEICWGENGVQHGGTLNPQWVEWLMGYPIGWTELNHSATP